MRLQDKVTIITGAGAGMGRCMATLFASEGANVVATDINGDALATLAREIAESGHEITTIQGSVADLADANAMVDDTVEKFGRLDVLVNNAGVIDHLAGIDELTDDVWRRVMSINLDGPMYTMRRAVTFMLKQGQGNIINIASTSGIGGGSSGAAYAASKHGLVGLTRSTAWMYANKGIRCNAICPGGVDTGIHRSVDPAQQSQAGMERIMRYAHAMPRLFQPEEVAKLALCLASDDTTYVNGAIIPIDGGWTAA